MKQFFSFSTVINVKRISPTTRTAFPFQPAHIRFFLEEFAANAKLSLDANGPSTEDVRRAKSNVVRRLPDAKGASTRGKLFNLLKDDIQASAMDGRPSVVDFGCVLGALYAQAHPNSSVVCVHEGGMVPANAHDAPANLLHIASPGKFDDLRFSPFFEMCNYFTLVFALGPLLESGPSKSVDPMLALISRMLPSSAAVFTAVPTDAAAAVRSRSPSQWSSFSNGNGPRDYLIRGLSTTPLYDMTTRAWNGHQAQLTVLKLVPLQSIRGCRATWDESDPLEPSSLRSIVFDEGLLSFFVLPANAPMNASGLGVRPMFHPLQYAPSINVGTLLGAGVEEATRMRFMGDMVSSHRYENPFPHNWLFGAGGAVFHNRWADPVYASVVDESKQYWGKTASGYLHVLAHHLCLPVDRFELPSFLYTPALSSVLSGRSMRCPGACERCGDSCGYPTAEGSMPCEECLVCGSVCLADQGATFLELVKKNTTASTAVVAPAPAACHANYPSLEAATSSWSFWEAKAQSSRR